MHDPTSESFEQDNQCVVIVRKLIGFPAEGALPKLRASANSNVLVFRQLLLEASFDISILQ